MKVNKEKNSKKENIIDAMAPEEVLNELKEKRLPTYGTAAERKDRLKKQYGINPRGKTGNSAAGNGGGHTGSVVE